MFCPCLPDGPEQLSLEAEQIDRGSSGCVWWVCTVHFSRMFIYVYFLQSFYQLFSSCVFMCFPNIISWLIIYLKCVCDLQLMFGTFLKLAFAPAEREVRGTWNMAPFLRWTTMTSTDIWYAATIWLVYSYMSRLMTYDVAHPNVKWLQ